MTGRVRPVLFASEYYPPFAPGGAEWTNAEWARALASRGQPVVIVTPNYGAARHESAAGVDVVRVPFPLKLSKGQKRVPGLIHRNPLWDVYFALCVAWVAYRRDVRVIHAQGKGALVGSWLAARALGRPVLATVRDVGLICPLGHCPVFETTWKTFDCSTRQYVEKCVPFHLENYQARAGRGRRAWLWLSVRLSWLDHLVRRRALSRVDAVVGVSQRILAIHPERIVPSARQHVVHSLPPRDETGTVPDAARVRRQLGIGDGPLVLYVGKLSPGKGTKVLLDALDPIRKAVPGARFAFAGKGIDLPVRDDVHRLGQLAHPVVLSLYGAADVVVSPSVWPEPLSRVIVEAMHFGRPVVATDVGGSSEAVEHDVTGLLVPANDAAALAGAIATLLRDPGRRERMGQAARARLAAVFGEDKVVSALLDAYAAAARRPA